MPTLEQGRRPGALWTFMAIALALGFSDVPADNALFLPNNALTALAEVHVALLMVAIDRGAAATEGGTVTRENPNNRGKGTAHSGAFFAHHGRASAATCNWTSVTSKVVAVGSKASGAAPAVPGG